MKIESLKELQQLIQLLRKTGVESCTVDGITLNLGPMPIKHKPRPIIAEDPMENIAIPKPNILDPIAAAKAHAAEQTKKIQEYIETDSPSEEQLLMWSAPTDSFEGQQWK